MTIKPFSFSKLLALIQASTAMAEPSLNQEKPCGI